MVIKCIKLWLPPDIATKQIWYQCKIERECDLNSQLPKITSQIIINNYDVIIVNRLRDQTDQRSKRLFTYVQNG